MYAYLCHRLWLGFYGIYFENDMAAQLWQTNQFYVLVMFQMSWPELR